MATDVDDELIADLLDVVDGMVAEDELELASRRDNATVALRLFNQLQREPALDIEAWLVDQDVVVELYLATDEVAARFAPVLARLAGAEPEPKWNDELAARILEAPDDLTARTVFGDWLEAAGDPRGELVQLQVRRQANPHDRALADREAVFLRRYHTYLMGPLADHDAKPMFRYGFIDELDVEPHGFVQAREHPSLRFLRKLVVRGRRDDLLVLAGHLPPRVTSLHIAARLERSEVLPLHDIVRGAEHLEELRCFGAVFGIDLGELRLPRLRSLDLGFHAVTGEGWGDALPVLEELGVECHHADDQPIDAALAVLARPPPRLRSLRLTGTYVERWIRRLVDTPLLSQLTALDLSGAQLGGLQQLFVVERARFEHLEHIDVRDTRPEWATAALAQLGPHVLAGSKRRLIPTDPQAPYEEGDEDEDDDEEEDDASEPMADAPNEDDEDEEAEDDEDDGPDEVDFDREPPDRA